MSWYTSSGSPVTVIKAREKIRPIIFLSLLFRSSSREQEIQHDLRLKQYTICKLQLLWVS